MFDLAIIIPLYNEEECLPTLQDRLETLRKALDARKLSVDWVFVNDGSSDRTGVLLAEAFAAWPSARILTHEVNRGFGAAIRTGLEAARATWVATVDADTNYDPRDIPVLLDAARERNVDLVTASPWHPDGSRRDFPLRRYIYSIGAAKLYGLALAPRGLSIYTFTAGFRVYRGARLAEILPRSSDFIATAELFVNAILKGWTYYELPWKVADRQHGRSKLNTLKTIRGHIVHIGRILMRRILERA